MMTDGIRVRCTDEQRERWERAAGKARRALGDWVRLVLDAACGLPEPEEEEA